MSNIAGKSLAAAIGLNLVLPGVGYMYLGRVILGLGALLLVAAMTYSAPLLMLIPTWLGMNLVMAIDMVILFNKAKSANSDATTYPCPFCAERIQRAASICRFCKSALSPSDDSPATDIYTQSSGGGRNALTTIMGAIAVILLLGAAAIFILTRDTTFTPLSTVAPKASNVSPLELVSSYEKNEVAADERFKGAFVEFSGRVSNIGKDLLDNPYVTVSTGDPSSIREVQCALASEAVTESTKLSRGDGVTMRGTVLGLMMHVQLDGCTFVRERPVAERAWTPPKPRTPSPEKEIVPEPPADAWHAGSTTSMSITGWVRLLGDTAGSLNELAFESGRSLQVVVRERKGTAMILEVVPPSLLPMLPIQPKSDDLVRWVVLSIDGDEMEFAVFESESMPLVETVNPDDVCGDDCQGSFRYFREK